MASLPGLRVTIEIEIDPICELTGIFSSDEAFWYLECDPVTQTGRVNVTCHNVTKIYREDELQYNIENLACKDDYKDPNMRDNYMEINKQYIGLGDYPKEQVIEYETNDDFILVNFDTTSNNIPPKKVKIVDLNGVEKETITDCEYNKPSLTCIPNKDKVPGSEEGITYKVMAINACGLEEDTKINLQVIQHFSSEPDEPLDPSEPSYSDNTNTAVTDNHMEQINIYKIFLFIYGMIVFL